MNGRAIASGAMAGGVAVIGALGVATQVGGSDPQALLDGVEAAAVTPVEKRNEQEEWFKATRDASRDDVLALREGLPQPQDLPVYTAEGLRARLFRSKDERPTGPRENEAPMPQDGSRSKDGSRTKDGAASRTAPATSKKLPPASPRQPTQIPQGPVRGSGGRSRGR